MNIIYTCITNEYDTLRPIVLPEGWAAMCFTDRKMEFDRVDKSGWMVLHIDKYDKNFRDVKICPHKYVGNGFDKYVWIDANLIPQIDLNELVNDKEGFWVMEHPDRVDIVSEAFACIDLKKDSRDIIIPQIEKYQAYGFDCMGLVATGVIIRDKPCKEFSEAWWSEVKNHSVRDQISFPYVAWRQKFEYKTFPFLQGFKKMRHNGK